jgi:High potential iron-sulfur protein
VKNTTSRRQIVKLGISGSVLAPLFWLVPNRAMPAALQPLSPSDTQAQALGFVTDASTVNAAANPTFKAGQKCATCAQFQGKQGDATAGCAIFPGHSVPAGGWCKVWAQKPAA